MQPSTTQQYYKVILLGETSVGKTSLVRRWTDDIFDESIMPTIGSGNFFKIVEDDQGPIPVSLWDTAGQEQYRAIAPQYIRNAKCGIIVASVIDKSSFEKVDEWAQVFKENTYEGTPIILALSKVDLLPFQKVLEMSEPFKDKFQYIFFVSSKIGENVDALFTRAAVLARETVQKSRRRSESIDLAPPKKETCAC